MSPIVAILIVSISTWLRSRLSMQMEFIAWRHRVAVYHQSVSRPKLRPLGLTLASVTGLAASAGIRATPDRAHVAKEAISRLLARFESEAPTWASRPVYRSPRTHPRHVAVQSNVGLISYRGRAS
jgi:hypothetical protein